MATKQQTRHIMRFDSQTTPDAAMRSVQAEIKRLGWTVGKVPVKIILYGDPDGAGDLQHTKQYALEFTKPKEVSNAA